MADSVSVGRCPNCFVADVGPSHDPVREGGSLLVEVRCNVCAAAWTNRFELVAQENLEVSDA